MGKDELSLIKKKYGEKMMHYCRENFASILETNGQLINALYRLFEPNHFVYEDMESEDMLEEFKNAIYEMFEDKKEEQVTTNKTPEELMAEAGYILHPECKSEKDIQAFRKYWRKDEELCTFNGNRLDTCRVWFATKVGVNNIKRSDFKNPKRQDEYGVSVISIQFSKGYHTHLSIKNRYNHTVKNPDATFSNNLENIIPGLTEAFYRVYGVKDECAKDSSFELINYVKYGEKFYRYNLEKDAIFYCHNNIVIDANRGSVTRVDKNRYLLFDNYVLDFKDKKILTYDGKEDEFTKSIGEFINVDIKVIKDSKELVFRNNENKNIRVVVNKYGGIEEYHNDYVTSVGDNFLRNNKSLSVLKLPNLTSVGNEFLRYNRKLIDYDFDNLVECGDYFLAANKSINKIEFKKLRYCKNSFMCFSRVMEIKIDNLLECGNAFMYCDSFIEKISANKLIKCGDNFLSSAISLEELVLDNLIQCGNEFLISNGNIRKISLKNLGRCGDKFLINSTIKNLSLPSLVKCGDSFLFSGTDLGNIELVNLKECGDMFIFSASLEKLTLKNLTICGDDFLAWSKASKRIVLPSLVKCGDNFMNEAVTNELHIRELEVKGDRFLNDSHIIKHKIYKSKNNKKRV